VSGIRCSLAATVCLFRADKARGHGGWVHSEVVMPLGQAREGIDTVAIGGRPLLQTSWLPQVRDDDHSCGGDTVVEVDSTRCQASVGHRR